jgi:glycosyltransferase involved in cell wall biosynthesis
MVARKIGLVHPPLESPASGGNVYNRRLLEFAGRSGAGLVSLPCRENALPGGMWDLLAWDSLLLDRVARIAGERVALLLHYLPSLEPVLDAERKESLEALEDRAAARADFAIATGRPVAEAAGARWPGKPVFLCEPGVVEAFSPRRTAKNAMLPVKLLTVANLLPAKGHCRLLEMLGQLRHLSWHWHVVGECCLCPAMADELRDRAALAGLTDRVTLHGALPQEDVAALMSESDLLISPSTFEAYGMAVAEAAAAGLPVLANRVGAAEQLVAHGATGFLAATGDWESFARYLEKLLEDAALRAVLRDNLRHAAVRGWDRTLEDFQTACETMLT